MLLLRPRETTPLSYRVDGRQLSGAVVSGAKPRVVRFGEGSVVTLRPDSSAEVTALHADGARVRIHRGSANVHVVHRSSKRWTFDAGPYTVQVTGTEFELRWSEAGGELDVALHEGSVVVSGPAMREPLRVRAGQRLRARASRAEVFITRLADDASAAAPALPSYSATPLQDVGDAAAPSDNLRDDSPAVEADRSWAELVAAREYGAVLSAVQGRRMERCLASCSSDELSALADAGRYGGNAAVAVRALSAQRTRFPSSSRAKSAAFLLGHLAEARGDRSAALEWYETYLRETPRGDLAGSALGRRMVLLGATPAGRAAAETYLRLYPRGPYAPQAEALSKVR
jgi:hypothetical protein